MLQRVGWTQFPPHDLVLGSEHDVLGGSVGTNSTHAVPQVVFVETWNVCFIEDLAVVVWAECLSEREVVGEASVVMLKDEWDDTVDLIGEQPEVVALGLGQLPRNERLVLDLHLRDEEIVRHDALV